MRGLRRKKKKQGVGGGRGPPTTRLGVGEAEADAALSRLMADGALLVAEVLALVARRLMRT